MPDSPRSALKAFLANPWMSASSSLTTPRHGRDTRIGSRNCGVRFAASTSAVTILIGAILPLTTKGSQWVSGDYTLLLSADDLLTPRCPQPRLGSDGRAPRGRIRLRTSRFTSILTKTVPLANTPSDIGDWSITSGIEWLHAICSEGDNLITSPEVVVRHGIAA